MALDANKFIITNGAPGGGNQTMQSSALGPSDITSKLTDVVDDTTPQLGGNLDTQTFTVDGRDVSTDGAKLDGIETSADVTDAANVTAAGALMDSELTSIADVKALNQSVVSGAAPTFTNTNFTEATDKNYVTDAQQTVIGNTSGTNTGDEVAASATVSGISELATIAEIDTGTDAVRTITPAGLAGSALQTKADSVETNADVTDTANVTAAGALMDSELTSIADVKALDQGVATTDTPQFAAIELGHATANSLTASGGILSIEGDPLSKTERYVDWPIEIQAWAPFTTAGATAGTTVYGSNEIPNYIFDSASEEGIYLATRLPEDYAGGAIRWAFDWDAVATASGTIVGGLSAGAFGDSDAFSTALGTERTITDTLITVGDRHKSPNDATGITIAGTPVAGDFVFFKFVCKTSGTIAVDQLVCGITLQHLTLTTQPAAFA